MRPYYDADGITIYHGNCLDVLPLLPVSDLLLTDPPYGLEWSSTGFMQAFKTDWRAAAKWDVCPSGDTFQTIKRAATEWVVWGGNYFAAELGNCKAPFVWDKQTGANNFADGEIAFTSFTTGTVRIFRHQWCGAFKDSERGVRNVHPTQKPIALMCWCLGWFPNAQTVLDPFMGSGTTLVAAKRMNRNAIGIEVEERYCEMAAERLAQGVLDLSAATSPVVSASADLFVD